LLSDSSVDTRVMGVGEGDGAVFGERDLPLVVVWKPM